ncbi:hypothetical protein [Capnocytophaga sputigena]|uniref:hypothetical protein n=1 Tax=Capnocytophaga sputigena TaxID=1019 RepID=UPI0028E65D41|nr:hypothetical protein [Capnocytophaga sputigena]
MNYYTIKSYSKHITEENFMLEMIDLNDNRWLINYGMQLDESFDYVNFKLYGEEKLFFDQDIITPYFGIYLASERFQNAIFQNSKISKEIQLLSFRLFNANDEEVKHNYKIINFLQTEECIDWEQSYFKVRDETKKSYVFLDTVFDFQKIALLTKDWICVDSEKSIFVSEAIKNEWEKMHLNSLTFSSVS